MIHGLAGLPNALVLLVRIIFQGMVPSSAPGRHPEHANVWLDRPGRGTDRSCNPIGRTLVRIVRLVRAFSGRPLSRIPRLSSIFSGQAFHASPAALSTPRRRTAVTFSFFCALFFASSPSSAGPARNRPHLSPRKKQRAWRPRQRIIYGIASLSADLVRLVRLVRTFLQRTISDSAPNRHPGQSFRPSPAALSTPSERTTVTFCAFCAFFVLFCSGTAEQELSQTRLRLHQNRPNLRAPRKQRARRGSRYSRITLAACRKAANRRKWMP